jgi:hypothetical protein
LQVIFCKIAKITVKTLFYPVKQLKTNGRKFVKLKKEVFRKAVENRAEL